AGAGRPAPAPQSERACQRPKNESPSAPGTAALDLVVLFATALQSFYGLLSKAHHTPLSLLHQRFGRRRTVTKIAMARISAMPNPPPPRLRSTGSAVADTLAGTGDRAAWRAWRGRSAGTRAALCTPADATFARGCGSELVVGLDERAGAGA